jgi:Leucine-rich repeat (LRR) protein
MTKKLFLLGILFLMFLSMSGFGLTYGDVDGNGAVNIVDGLLIAQYCVGLPVSNFNATAADVDAANGVTIVDALLIAQFYVGIINKFPADQPTPTPVSGSENIINGDFANGTTGWTIGYYAPGVGSASVSNGELHIGISNGGTATWNVQITQGSINIVSGTTYTFSFAARSASARTIEANVGMSVDPYTSYFASSSLNISTTMTTYSFTFTAQANDLTARVEFNCGLAAIDVYIDNVSLIAGPAPTPGSTPASVIINFPDTNLEAAVRTQINKPSGSIYDTDVNTLPSFAIYLIDVSNITGLEYFKGLTKLGINYNWKLTDITPLANLTGLKDLNIGSNSISNITPLRNLTNLTQLCIVLNGISDLSPLASLTNLTAIRAECNNLVDITPLANLTKVTNLTLYDNDIVNIAPMSYLTNMTYLDISDNKIVDITPLESCTKLATLDLCNNPISDIKTLGKLTNLVDLKLNTHVLKDITPLATCTNLRYLNLDNNLISDITILQNMTSLKDVSLTGNPLNSSAQSVIDALRARGVVVIWTVN